VRQAMRDGARAARAGRQRRASSVGQQHVDPRARSRSCGRRPSDPAPPRRCCRCTRRSSPARRSRGRGRRTGRSSGASRKRFSSADRDARFDVHRPRVGVEVSGRVADERRQVDDDPPLPCIAPRGSSHRRAGGRESSARGNTSTSRRTSVDRRGHDDADRLDLIERSVRRIELPVVCAEPSPVRGRGARGHRRSLGRTE
jgi:hypothetical protein